MRKFMTRNNTDKALPLVEDVLYRMAYESRTNVTSPTSPLGHALRVLH